MDNPHLNESRIKAFHQKDIIPYKNFHNLPLLDRMAF